MKFEYSTRWVRANWHSEEQKKGLLGAKSTTQDARYVDLPELSTLILEACNQLAAEGYEVFSITPTVRGHWGTYEYTAAGHQISKESTAYGFSATDGAVVVGKRPAG